MSLLMLLSGAIPSFSGTPTDAAAVTDGVTAVLTTAGGASLVSQTPGNSGTSTVTSQAIAGPPAPATFAVLLVGRTGGQSTGALTGVTDTAGNTWAVATRGAGSGIANTRLEIWYCQNYTPATTVTFAGSAQASGWNLLGFTGLANASALDVASPDNSVTASGTTVTTPSVTTTASDLVIAAIEHGGTDGTPPGSPWTGLTGWTVNNTSGSGQAAYLTGATAGTYSATFTMTTARQAGVVIVGFKEAAASTTLTAASVADTAPVADAVTAQLSRPALSTLVDDFSTANSLWTYGSGISLTDGQLNLTIDGAYSGTIVSQGYYRAANSANHVQIVSSSTGAGYTDIYLGLDNGEANGTPPYRTISLDIENGSTITAYYFGTSGWETIGGTGYNSTAHRWLRLAHDGTNVLWQASPDGATWTNIASRSAATMDTALFERARLLVGSGGDGGGTAVLDNVGIVPSGAALTASGADSEPVADAATVAMQQARAGADTAPGVDAATVAITQVRAGADTAPVGDAAATSVTQVRAGADAALVADAATALLAAGRDGADSAPAADAIATVLSASRSPADTVAVQDVASSAFDRPAAAGDTLAVADGVTAAQDQGRPAGDAALVSDAVSVASDQARAGVDAEPVTDGVLVARSTAFSDTAGAADTVTATWARQATAADVASVADAVSTTTAGAGTASAADAVPAADAVTVTRTSTLVAADSASAADAVGVSMARSQSAADAAPVADTVTAVWSRSQAAADVEPVVDVASMSSASDATRNVADLLGVADAATLTRAAGRSPADELPVGDNVTVVISRSIEVADSAPVGDQAAASAGLVYVVADGIGLTDQIGRVQFAGRDITIVWEPMSARTTTARAEWRSLSGGLTYRTLERDGTETSS